MKYVSQESEAKHLKDFDSDEIAETVIELSKDGKSLRAITEVRGISKSTVSNILKKNDSLDTLSKLNGVDSLDSVDTKKAV